MRTVGAVERHESCDGSVRRELKDGAKVGAGGAAISGRAVEITVGSKQQSGVGSGSICFEEGCKTGNRASGTAFENGANT